MIYTFKQKALRILVFLNNNNSLNVCLGVSETIS